jgi:hypothetical protein
MVLNFMDGRNVDVKAPLSHPAICRCQIGVVLELSLHRRRFTPIQPPDLTLADQLPLVQLIAWLAAESENIHSSNSASRFEHGDEEFRFTQTSLRFAIENLGKYINLVEELPAYWVAMILHPGHRKRWIERYLDSEQAYGLFVTFRQFFNKYTHFPSS